MKKNILFIVLGIIIGTGIGVYAINASDIDYRDTKVDQALDYLYNHIEGTLGQTYSSTNYGHERTITKSTTIENLPSGKYICSAAYSGASAANQNEEGSWNSGFSFTGCDTSNILSQHNVASGAANAHSSVYELAQHDVKIFECNISNPSNITATLTSASAANWIPWVISLDCTSVE